MKVIFLDIDGVLNTEVYICSVFQCVELMGGNAHKDMRGHMDGFGHQFDPLAVRALKLIIDKTDAKIVISSTWRGARLSVMQDLWKKRNLPGDVIDVTPFLHKEVRGEEISAWLKSRNDVDGYLIIDDDSDMLDRQKPHFLRTDFQYGLMINQYENAVEILNLEY